MCCRLRSLYRSLLILLIVLGGGFCLKASLPRPLADTSLKKDLDSCKIKVSLLVAGGLQDEIYAAYGHVALRVTDAEKGTDYVYNWGIFDFYAPNFIGKFIEGNTTDYMLGVEDAPLFIAQYTGRGTPIYELPLRLTPKEIETLSTLLTKNLESPYYLYNFVFDNCSTRPFVLLEKVVEGSLQYPKVKETTRRKMVDGYATCRPWLIFGTDIVLGKTADEWVGAREQLFLPLYAKEILKGIKVISPQGKERLLAGTEITYPSLFEPVPPKELPFLLSPFFVSLLLFVVTIASCFFKTKKMLFFSLWTTFFFVILGLVGCLVTYLSFFSLHPLVYPNYNILVFHPFYLILAIPLVWIHRNRVGYIYHFINGIVQLVFLLGISWFSSQVFNPAVLLFSLASLAISARYIGRIHLSFLRRNKQSK